MIAGLVQRLGGPVLRWGLVAVAVAVIALMWRADRLRIDALELERDQALDAAAVTQAALAWQQEQTQALAEAVDERATRIERDERVIDDRRVEAKQLEHDDEATADWADQPVPAAVQQWVRDLQANDTAAPGADRADVHAQAAAGTDAPDRSQP